MRHNIKQTFTSIGDPSANGAAERWIDLIKVKATVLLRVSFQQPSGVMLFVGSHTSIIRRPWVRSPRSLSQILDSCCCYAQKEIINFRIVLNWES